MNSAEINNELERLAKEEKVSYGAGASEEISHQGLIRKKESNYDNKRRRMT